MIKDFKEQPLRRPQRKKYQLSHFKGVNTGVAEENLPFSYSPKSYNFCFGKGVLESGYGLGKGYIRKDGIDWEIKKRGITVKFLKFFHYTMHNQEYRLEKVAAYADDGKIYDMSFSQLYSGFSPVGNYGPVLCAVPYVYHDMDGLLVSTETGLYFLREFTMTRLSFSKIIKTMCVHNDRVFAVMHPDEYKLFFSYDFDPANWNSSLTEGGYISFDTEIGKLIKVMSFGGQVCLFFEHGIMRLNAFHLQSEFHLQKLYLSPGTIYKDTIVACGDRIMFAASDGIFAFDGLQIKKVMEEIEGLFSVKQEAAHAVHHGGKYYLACNLNMDSTLSSGTNSLVIYDTWKQSFDLVHDVTLQCMLSLDLETVSGVLAEANYPVDFLGLIERSGKVNAAPTYKLWTSPVTTLGSHSGKKLLRDVRVRCEGSGSLKLWLDGTLFRYELGEGLNKVRVMRLFDKMQVALASNVAEVRITSAEITVDHYGE